jgi:hypothetical protein
VKFAAQAAPLAAVALTAACGSIAAQERPAVIAAPTEQSRAELLGVVTSAFNGRPVALADDALTSESVLIVERLEPRDAQRRPLDGRARTVPEHFRLVLRGSSCELVRQSDGRRWSLTRTDCVPNRRAATE